MKRAIVGDINSNAPLAIKAKRRSSLLIAIGLLITSLFLIAFLIVPQSQQIWSAIHKSKEIKADIDKLQLKVKELDAAVISPEYISTKGLVDKALPTKKPLLEVLTSLDQVRRAAGVELADLTTSPGSLATGSASQKAAPQSDEQVLSLKFTVVGTYEQVSKFMELIETTTPFTTIRSFSISEQSRKATSAQAEEVSTEQPEQMRVSMESDSYFANIVVLHKPESVMPKLTNQNTVVLGKLQEFSTIELPEQREVTGGGLQDLFGLPGIADL